MKRLFLALGLAIASSSCTVFWGNIGLYLEVTGTEGSRYVGSVGGTGALRSVEGTIPATIQIGQEKQALVSLQKPGGGWMRVTIYNNGNLIKTEYTEATDGTVSMEISI